MESMVLANIGVENFRDIGGYNANGRKVKQSMVYRSAKLDGVTEDGQELLENIGINTIIDLRGDEEVANNPTLYERDDLVKLRIPVSSGDIKPFVPYFLSGKLKESDAQALMCSAYRSFVTGHSKQYAEFLDTLLDESNYPLLVHCTAGKDRTGYASALLLLLLGVQWDDVLNNYLLTNDYLKDYISRIDVSSVPEAAKKAFAVLMMADEKYLGTAFSVIGKNYEEVCSYAATVLNFDKEKQEKLKSILLE